MIALDELPAELVARVLADDAEATRAMVRRLDPIVPKALRSDQSEAAFGKQVRALATTLHWWSYHPQLSRWSERGWPDWVFIRGERVVFAELKRDDTTITPHQARVITMLRNAGQEVYIWRPATGLEEIARLLA